MFANVQSRAQVSVVVAVAALAGTPLAYADRGLRPAEAAGKYMTSIVKEKLAGEYELAWESLYPPHQRVASLEAYVACEGLTPPAGTLTAFKVLRVFDERIAVAGAKRKLMTRAVRVRVAVASPLYTLHPVTITQTFHAIAVRGQWKWILSTDQYAYYSAGSCPYS
jgi:hypothetical protein